MNCKPSEIYNIDTGECLHQDYHISVLQTTNYKGQRITGKGESIYKLLLKNGETQQNIKDMKIAYTYTLEDYIKNLNENIHIPSPVFSGTISIKNITFNTRELPRGIEYIPDFMSIKQSDALFNVIKSSEGKNSFSTENNVIKFDRKMQDTIILEDYFPPYINCLCDIMINSKYIDRYPDNIYINYLYSGQGMNNHIDDIKYGEPVLILSLGTHCLINFTNIDTKVSTQFPLLSGSLLILKNEARYKYIRSIKNNKIDIYSLKGFPEQKWKRNDRISIIFRFLK
jgi:hypothetical protein